MAKNSRKAPSKEKRNRSRASKASSKTCSRSTVSISDLPDEILKKFLPYVSEFDLIFIIPLVCKRWKNLVGDIKLSGTSLYACSRVASKTLLKCISVAPNLQDLTLYNRKDTNMIHSAVVKFGRNPVLVRTFDGTSWNTEVVRPQAWLNRNNWTREQSPKQPKCPIL